jgi:hypothetical protein
MCMLSICLARCVICNGEISLLYNYTVIWYTRGRTSNSYRFRNTDVRTHTQVGTPVCGEVYEVFSCMKIFGTIHNVV